MNMTLTRLQKKVFAFICQFAKKQGFPPSYSEIAANFGFSSDGTVRTYLEQLEKKGFIKRLGKARGIKIIKSMTPSSIPILGSIAAGSPKLAIEDHIGTLSDINELDYHQDRFCLKVHGDSMINAGILDGDLAVIQRNVQVENSQIGAVLFNDEATLKRVFYEQNRIRLQPENDAYEPIYLENEAANNSIIGRYIALVRQA